mgnify:CR=1 FL=1
MWFGDLVTMNWFDDVWTKEVFANYFAALITEPLFPQVNHQLNWMKTYTAASLSEDRTPGTTAIRQPLDNLQNAGLIYGQIIYNKAPVMMVKLVESMGKEAFREGIQEYLKTYAYANATWDDLIQILDSKTEQDLAAFSDVWVNQKGMPIIKFEISDKQLTIHQQDHTSVTIISHLHTLTQFTLLTHSFLHYLLLYRNLLPTPYSFLFLPLSLLFLLLSSLSFSPFTAEGASLSATVLACQPTQPAGGNS